MIRGSVWVHEFGSLLAASLAFGTPPGRELRLRIWSRQAREDLEQSEHLVVPVEKGHDARALETGVTFSLPEQRSDPLWI